jgi:hypothetical protein
VSLLTISELGDAIQRSISSSTVPSSTQVQEYIDVIEGEVKGLLSSCFAPWPSSSSDPIYPYIRQTVLEGAKNLLLRAIYAQSGQQASPAEIGYSRSAYDQRLARMCDYAKAMREDNPDTGGAFIPLAAAPEYSPGLAGTFAEYTLARNYIEVYRYRNGNLPWPL